MFGMKETLSSNSLFHFTRGAANLIGILKKGIAPRYCLENFSMFDFGLSTENETFELAVPMVCFCDIPLSKVKYHLSFYGSYGIAFSKDWGVKMGISPILYVDPKSETTRSIQDAIYYFSNSSMQDEISYNTYQKLLRLVRFTKPYQGKFWRNGKYEDEIVRFYDEREWRFVPDIHLVENENIRPWISKEDFLKDINRSALDTQIEEMHTLNFKPDDIRYIIIDRDKDVMDIIDYIEKSLAGQYDTKDIKKLIAKVLTKEQIEHDF